LCSCIGVVRDGGPSWRVDDSNHATLAVRSQRAVEPDGRGRGDVDNKGGVLYSYQLEISPGNRQTYPSAISGLISREKSTLGWHARVFKSRLDSTVASRSAVEMEFEPESIRTVSNVQLSSNQRFGITHVSPTSAVNEFGLNDNDPCLPTSIMCGVPAAYAARARTGIRD